tara:strand:- start:12499 stop:14076 length:1578 start_codon:yes stop_codon:yes gene_type:complete
MSSKSEKLEQIREAAESDLATFIKLVSPKSLLGSVHLEVCDWWSRKEGKTHQLTLLPRDHQKSRLIGFRVAHYLTTHPDHRVLYISSTANLAEKQLKFIKDVLTSKIYRRYWPEMVNESVDKREKWTNTEISLDHPKRMEEGVRDPSVFTAGLTTSITGLHCDVAVLDDVVVQENAYTNDGRSKVKDQYSLLSSVEGTGDGSESGGSLEWAVGTRYHPKDLYNDLMEMREEEYDDDGEITDYNSVYEKFEREVEDHGDGTGQFLWPRQQRGDGKWFGFDRQILAKKRAKYLNRTQFRAQYYNNPNSEDGTGISGALFQYYDPKYLSQSGGKWFYKAERINVFAAIDFAFSLTKRADYTCIAVVGISSLGQLYILDIDRFKTDAKIVDYYNAILRLHIKWDFRKMRAECTAAQKAIVKELKNSYITPNGLSLSVQEHSPTRSTGSKEERLKAILEPRYDNMSIWHYRGGHCQTLEDELILEHPPHDDVKNAVADAIEICVPPARMHRTTNDNVVSFNSRFGGVAYA